jgi:hypothetical protein
VPARIQKGFDDSHKSFAGSEVFQSLLKDTQGLTMETMRQFFDDATL